MSNPVPWIEREVLFSFSIWGALFEKWEEAQVVVVGLWEDWGVFGCAVQCVHNACASPREAADSEHGPFWTNPPITWTTDHFPFWFLSFMLLLFSNYYSYSLTLRMLLSHPRGYYFTWFLSSLLLILHDKKVFLLVTFFITQIFAFVRVIWAHDSKSQ